MQVIKNGQIEQWSCRVRCGDCNSELEITQEDLRHSTMYGYFVDCGVCMHVVYVASFKIPNRVKSTVEIGR